ncbi:DUF2130 domain-containing protein [Geovibrio ferrireducens]|uniref:DUF2130 domain-containing protein n=1 Tax=Geovibrio ferrireducens TaxID=46201 RepID=UPI002246DCE1|nr:DUF2130 domain-containing protein [Geovibrio ferrireducens]
MKNNTVKCPNCGKELNVNEVIFSQISQELEKNFAVEQAKEKQILEKEREELKKRTVALEQAKEQMEVRVQEEAAKNLAIEKKKLESKLKAKIIEENAESLKILEDELSEKSAQLKDFNKTKAEIERLKREKSEMEEHLKASFEKQFNEKLESERIKLKSAEDEHNRMKILEKEEVINQLKKQLQYAQRKAEQGSMQLQGEVQELALEDILKREFISDEILEVAKGKNGADVIQVVRNYRMFHCGKIIYESKRTKAFNKEWITKLKRDQLEEKADLAVLITETLPEGIDKIGLYEGVWICSFDNIKGLVMALRENLIRVAEVLKNQQNKGDKVNLLYSYLTSNEFKMQMEAIIEGFLSMKNSLEKERKGMEKLWKEREKQIERVLINATGFFGSVKGIAGNELPDLDILELGFEE